jgi:hypothetical protein
VPPCSECCVVVGDGGREAYTAIMRSGILSRERDNVAEAEAVDNVEGNMLRTVTRGATALPWSETPLRMNGTRRNLASGVCRLVRGLARQLRRQSHRRSPRDHCRSRPRCSRRNRATPRLWAGLKKGVRQRNPLDSEIPIQVLATIAVVLPGQEDGRRKGAVVQGGSTDLRLPNGKQAHPESPMRLCL